MTKSSEVLRLAAEHQFINDGNGSISFICGDDEKLFTKAYSYAFFCGYLDADEDNQVPMILCLAAAIAESEGD